MPILAALFSAMGVFGGYLIAVRFIGVDAGSFWSQMQASVDVREDIGGDQHLGPGSGEKLLHIGNQRGIPQGIMGYGVLKDFG